MTHLGLRIVAGMVWAAAFALLAAGTAAQTHDHRLILFAWAGFLCFVGLTLTLALAFEHVLTKESDRNAQITADAVGEAVGRYINDRPDPDVVSISRRGV